jgi:hypothetical protein
LRVLILFGLVFKYKLTVGICDASSDHFPLLS